jgi:hypothetical protein
VAFTASVGATAAFAFGDSAAFAVPGATVFEAAGASLADGLRAAFLGTQWTVRPFQGEGCGDVAEPAPHEGTSDRTSPAALMSVRAFSLGHQRSSPPARSVPRSSTPRAARSLQTRSTTASP